MRIYFTIKYRKNIFRLKMIISYKNKLMYLIEKEIPDQNTKKSEK